MEKPRRQYTAQEKATILRRHLVDGIQVSTLCDECGMNPTVFYRWQKELFEKAVVIFERTEGNREHHLQQENEALKAKLARKDEVLGELMEEHVHLKKSLGEI